MQKLRKAALAATTVSALSITACVLSRSFNWPTDRAVFLIIGTAAGCSAAVIFCTSLSLDALNRAKSEMIESVAGETQALRRSMMVTMQEYGDSRAIDAFVTSERRHVVNERAGHETVDLNGVAANMTNVTPLRKRS